MKSSTETLVKALRILACDIQSEDGVANAAIAEAAERLAELERENAALRETLKRWLKVTDDCHHEQQEVGYSEYNITVGLVCDTRALLDTVRKEAQP